MTTATVLDTKTKQVTREIKMWNVVMLNDDYTPFDFVINVLTELFNKDFDTAEAIAMNIHDAGRGIAGTYTKEIALQKSSDVNRIAKHNGHPLKTVAEEV